LLACTQTSAHEIEGKPVKVQNAGSGDGIHSAKLVGHACPGQSLRDDQKSFQCRGTMMGTGGMCDAHRGAMRVAFLHVM
jgi:hypothetical protein